VGTSDEEALLKAHFLVGEQLAKCANDLRALKMQPENLLPFLASGRLVWVVVHGTKKTDAAAAEAEAADAPAAEAGAGQRSGGSGGRRGVAAEEAFEDDFGWGAVVDFKAPKKGGFSVADAADISVEVALSCRRDPPPSAAGSSSSNSGSSGNPHGRGGGGGGKGPHLPQGEPKPVVDPTHAEVRVVRVALAALKDVSAVRIHLPRDLGSADARAGVSKTLGEVARRLAKVHMHPLDPVADMKVAGDAVDQLLDRQASLEQRRAASPVTRWPDGGAKKLAAFAEKHALGEAAKALRKAAKQATAPAMKDAMKRMQRVSHSAPPRQPGFRAHAKHSPPA
jgi:hypothetical protein